MIRLTLLILTILLLTESDSRIQTERICYGIECYETTTINGMTARKDGTGLSYPKPE